jgi:hypothetical protein
VAYPNAWSEKDTVTYELPAGYALEKPEGREGSRSPGSANTMRR